MHGVVLRLLSALLVNLGFIAKGAWDVIKWAAVQAKILASMTTAFLTFVSLRLTKYFLLRVLFWGAVFAALNTFFSGVLTLIREVGSISLSTVVERVNTNTPLMGYEKLIWSGGLNLKSAFDNFLSFVSFWVSCFVAFSLYVRTVAIRRAAQNVLWKEPSKGLFTGNFI